MGVTTFDAATAVRGCGDGRYDVLPDQRFAVVAPGSATPPAVNGGVLIATVLRAVLDSSPHPHPIATSAHFLRVAKLEPASVQVTWLRQGKTAATARAAGPGADHHHRDAARPLRSWPGASPRRAGVQLDRRAARFPADRGVR